MAAGTCLVLLPQVLGHTHPQQTLVLLIPVAVFEPGPTMARRIGGDDPSQQLHRQRSRIKTSGEYTV
jgi:hypothetical protein